MSVTASSILNNLDTVAVFAGGLFAGTALYVSGSEQLALHNFDIDIQWRFFPYMYKATAVSQASTAAIAGVAGILHGIQITNAPFYRNLWIISGSVLVGLIPYTFIVLMSTNKTIIGDNKSIQAGNSSQFDANQKKELLHKWALGHLGRTIGSLVAFGAMAFGLSRHGSFRFRW